MNTETSAGAIVFCLGENCAPLFLLVLSARHNEWGFPKGHIEQGETELEAARREVFEETGVKDIAFINGFKETARYRTANSGKRSIYFLAKADISQSFVHDSEIKKAEWLGFEEALKVLKYPIQKEFLKKAFSQITGEQKL